MPAETVPHLFPDRAQPAPSSGPALDELVLVGSRCGPFAPALRLLAAGLVDPSPLVSARLPLERGVEALRLAAAPGTVKVLLDVGR